MKRYYAVEFWSGRNTTTGQPHPTTGRYSRAHSLSVFTSKHERDEYVSKGKVTTDMCGNCREAVTSKMARKLNAGLTTAEYNEMVDMIASLQDI